MGNKQTKHDFHHYHGSPIRKTQSNLSHHSYPSPSLNHQYHPNGGHNNHMDTTTHVSALNSATNSRNNSSFKGLTLLQNIGKRLSKNQMMAIPNTIDGKVQQQQQQHGNDQSPPQLSKSFSYHSTRKSRTLSHDDEEFDEPNHHHEQAQQQASTQKGGRGNISGNNSNHSMNSSVLGSSSSCSSTTHIPTESINSSNTTLSSILSLRVDHHSPSSINNNNNNQMTNSNVMEGTTPPVSSSTSPTTNRVHKKRTFSVGALFKRKSLSPSGGVAAATSPPKSSSSPQSPSSLALDDTKTTTTSIGKTSRLNISNGSNSRHPEDEEEGEPTHTTTATATTSPPNASSFSSSSPPLPSTSSPKNNLKNESLILGLKSLSQKSPSKQPQHEEEEKSVNSELTLMIHPHLNKHSHSYLTTSHPKNNLKPIITHNNTHTLTEPSSFPQDEEEKEPSSPTDSSASSISSVKISFSQSTKGSMSPMPTRTVPSLTLSSNDPRRKSIGAFIFEPSRFLVPKTKSRDELTLSLSNLSHSPQSPRSPVEWTISESRKELRKRVFSVRLDTKEASTLSNASIARALMNLDVESVIEQQQQLEQSKVTPHVERKEATLQKNSQQQNATLHQTKQNAQTPRGIEPQNMSVFAFKFQFLYSMSTTEHMIEKQLNMDSLERDFSSGELDSLDAVVSQPSLLSMSTQQVSSHGEKFKTFDDRSHEKALYVRGLQSIFEKLCKSQLALSGKKEEDVTEEITQQDRDSFKIAIMLGIPHQATKMIHHEIDQVLTFTGEYEYYVECKRKEKRELMLLLQKLKSETNSQAELVQQQVENFFIMKREQFLLSTWSSSTSASNSTNNHSSSSSTLQQNNSSQPLVTPPSQPPVVENDSSTGSTTIGISSFSRNNLNKNHENNQKEAGTGSPYPSAAHHHQRTNSNEFILDTSIANLFKADRVDSDSNFMSDRERVIIEQQSIKFKHPLKLYILFTTNNNQITNVPNNSIVNSKFFIKMLSRLGKITGLLPQFGFLHMSLVLASMRFDWLECELCSPKTKLKSMRAIACIEVGSIDNFNDLTKVTRILGKRLSFWNRNVQYSRGIGYHYNITTQTQQHMTTDKETQQGSCHQFVFDILDSLSSDITLNHEKAPIVDMYELLKDETLLGKKGCIGSYLEWSANNLVKDNPDNVDNMEWCRLELNETIRRKYVTLLRDYIQQQRLLYTTIQQNMNNNSSSNTTGDGEPQQGENVVNNNEDLAEESTSEVISTLQSLDKTLNLVLYGNLFAQKRRKSRSLSIGTPKSPLAFYPPSAVASNSAAEESPRKKKKEEFSGGSVTICFPNHSSLDEFTRDMILVSRNDPIPFTETSEYHLLKSFDRALWLRNNFDKDKICKDLQLFPSSSKITEDNRKRILQGRDPLTTLDYLDEMIYNDESWASMLNSLKNEPGKVRKFDKSKQTHTTCLICPFEDPRYCLPYIESSNGGNE
ncbi:hypothetical protein C9374_007500 [Naegleria lovaniensis]|uniref:Uncharacterized protein n=1 Tax=Naegleria lovaniensis TaxID=51637 RepID=A0AA88KIN4_NAELO|nr:uncharacterized protein C9374_007500 [Naegleria lovaniensis]KAG2379361.1 hypothetical protein C9374_007500 [Naegleria lovaniensis]